MRYQAQDGSTHAHHAKPNPNQAQDGSTHSHHSHPNPNQAQDGTTHSAGVGTPSYAAPEQLRSGAPLAGVRVRVRVLGLGSGLGF